MIKKTVLLTKTDGTKVCRLSSSNGYYLKRNGSVDKFAQVVCDEPFVTNYIETNEKIDLVALLKGAFVKKA